MGETREPTRCDYDAEVCPRCSHFAGYEVRCSVGQLVREGVLTEDEADEINGGLRG